MNDDGTMARVPDLIPFCKLHGLAMVSVAEMIRYRLATEPDAHEFANAFATAFPGQGSVTAH
jgi:3,4-dihydroxy 2-butanone 4-phosphate synthase/GTP cyclohydrolase II